MTGARLESINCGQVTAVPWGRAKRSGIDKRPVGHAVHLGPLGVEGDEIADAEFHGGLDQAVYAYAREDLDAWGRELGRALTAGSFGENLTTVGLDVQNARLGERWAVGGAVLEVSDVRIPCSVFQGFIGEPQWVRRFTEQGVPGAYLRVITPGPVQAGDVIEVIERRPHDLTVGLVFRARTTEAHLLPRLAEEPRASAAIRRALDAYRNE